MPRAVVIGALKGLAWGIPVAAWAVFTYALVTFDIAEEYSSDPELSFSVVTFLVLCCLAVLLTIGWEIDRRRR